MSVQSSISCVLLKSRNEPVWAHNYNRAVSFGVAGMLWPISGEMYKMLRRQTHEMISPTFIFRRAGVFGLLFGAVGGAMDHFDLARPTPEYFKPLKDEEKLFKAL
jgi:hypothetical protein